MDEYNLPSLLDSGVAPSYWKDLLDRFQFSGDISKNVDSQSKVTAGGGRIGYSLPVDQNQLILGLLGGGYSGTANTPQGKIPIRGYGLQGGDIAYQYGDNTVGADYQRIPNIGNLLNIYYKRQF
jgi:hypothetical protein